MFWNTRRSLTKDQPIKQDRPTSLIKVQRKEPQPKKEMTNHKGFVGLNTPSTTQQVFGLILQNQVATDSGVYWQYNIPVLHQNQKKLVLMMIGGQVTFIGVPAADFVPQLYIYATGVSGYLNDVGQGTQKIAILRARQIVSTSNAGIMYYTVIYSILDCPQWDLGLLRSLELKVGDSTGMTNGPLPSKVMVEFKILHLVY